MKTRLLGAVAVLAMAAATSPLLAQSATMSVNIPFEFSANGLLHPAGEYRITTSSGTTLVSFSNFDAGIATQVLTVREDAGRPDQTQSRVSFRRYGDRYFLSQVWNSHGSIGRRLAATKEETELAHRLPAGGFEALTVLARR